MTNSEIWMTCLTAVIAVAGVIGACIFNNQLDVMQGQLDEMKAASKIAEDTLIATQRPWVSVNTIIGPRGLFFDVNGANLDLIFYLKNTGPTPAVNVRIIGNPRIDVATNDRISELERICDAASKHPIDSKMFAHTVFPGDVLTLNMIYSFADQPLLDAQVAKNYGFIMPVVIGCIDYSFAFGDHNHHQSRFIYDLDFPIQGGGTRAIKVSDGDKAANLLRLSPWFEGGSFQAN